MNTYWINTQLVLGIYTFSSNFAVCVPSCYLDTISFGFTQQNKDPKHTFTSSVPNNRQTWGPAGKNHTFSSKGDKYIKYMMIRYSKTDKDTKLAVSAVVVLFLLNLTSFTNISLKNRQTYEKKKRKMHGSHSTSGFPFGEYISQQCVTTRADAWFLCAQEQQK